MAEDQTPEIANYVNRVLEGQASLDDLMELQRLHTRGLQIKQLSQQVDTAGQLADLLDLQGATARGLPGKRSRLTPDLRAGLQDLLELQGATARGLRAKRPHLEIDSPSGTYSLVETHGINVDRLLGGLRRPLPAGILYPVEFFFNGAMILDDDPLKIGLHNFADLQNFRYTNTGLEGIAGYTRITTNPLGAAPTVGIQFIATTGGVPASTLLVQAGTVIYPHTAIVPAASDFGAGLISVTGSTGGRFSLAPNSHVLYSNGTELLTWGGTTRPVPAFINYDEANTFQYDFTLRLNNILTDGAHRAILIRDTAGPDIWLHIGSTRPLQGIGFTIFTANAGASTSTVEYWNGSAWTAVAAFADGTAAAGVTLAVTGSMTFTSTVSTAKVRFLHDRLLYWYRVKVGATGTPDATVELSYVSVDMPIQSLIDIWDGIERTPIFAENGAARDFTLEVLEPSTAVNPIGLNVWPSNTIFAVFQDRQTALNLRILAGYANTVAATVTVYYWDGGAFQTVGTVTDDTLTTGITLSQTGTIAWDAPTANAEQIFQGTVPAAGPSILYKGPPGYAYWIITSALVDNTSHQVLIDTITGVPAQRWNNANPTLACTFPFTYAGRAMLAGIPSSNELNRIEYSAIGQPDVWNGEGSSDQGKAIFIGGHGALTAAISLSNRYYGTQREICVILKGQETWVMEGASPETFTLYQVSDVVGCPAPLTLTRAEIPVASEQQALRNVAMWCSAKGPVMFDGATLFPMRFQQPDGATSSVDAYFHAADSRFVNAAAWSVAHGWYDAQWGEYNLLLPSGSGQTTVNVWLVCDLRRRKWYRVVPAAYPRMAMQTEDATGDTYVYAGLASGHLVRLAFGTTWDGTNIAHQIDTGDIILPTGESGQSIWQETVLRYIKAVLVTETGAAASLTYAHSPNGTATFTTIDTLALVTAGMRWTRKTTPVNLRALSHQFRLTITTSDKSRAPQMLGFAGLFRTERQTLTDIF